LVHKKNLLTKQKVGIIFLLKINLTSDFANETSTKLIEGEIIASYYGPNEVGPRSLGNTSIFCDASNRETCK
jgi:predicted NodU family carbamoyl transferase